MSEVAIRAEPSPSDRDACRFVVSRPVHPGGPFFFKRSQGARGSPLAERLFQLPGVLSVLIAENVITLGKEKTVGWNELLKPVGAAIRSQLLSGVPCVVTDAPSTAGEHTDSELARLVQDLLDREINPGIASHGGTITVDKVHHSVLYIRMSGGCQGCASSNVTLKHGVEVVVRNALPQIADIVDATDHTSGKNPFYAPSL